MPISEVRATVGRFVSIRSSSSVIVAMITEVSCENLSRSDNYIAVASVDLLGEILNASDKPKFQRGVTNYPTIGDAVDLITSQELRTIYAPTGSDQINVGFLQQDRSVIAYVDIEEMLSKHFAVLGSTGVGKSTGVSLLLNEILKARPNLRIFLLDVHNEYGRCFGDRALVLNPRNLKLPFWLFNFEEIVDVLFGGRAGVPEEPRHPRRGDPARQGRLHPVPECRPYRPQAHRSQADRLHRRHPCALSPGRPDVADRRAHGQAGKPLVAHHLSQADLAHRGGAQRSALRLHVRQRQCRRRHHGRGDQPSVPPARQRQADDGDAARRLPGRGHRFRRFGAVPHGLRFRPLERRRLADAVRLRGSAPLRLRRPQHRLRPDPQGGVAHCQGRP